MQEKAKVRKKEKRNKKRDVRVQKREQTCQRKTRESGNERDVRRRRPRGLLPLYSDKRNNAITEQGNWKNREQPFPGLDRCHVEFHSA